MRLIIFFFILTTQTYAQFHKMDSLGNFYVVDYKLVWQKYYDYDDKEELNELLKTDYFTSDLDILKFGTSTITKPYKLMAGNLPEYAQHEYKAFLTLDFIGGRLRVSVKQIVFPDFQEKIYYNGVRQHDSRGTLEKYILRQDGLIRRNSANIHVLNSFDTAFSEIFDAKGYSYE